MVERTGDPERRGRISALHTWLDAPASDRGDLAAIARDLHQIRRLFLAEIAERLRVPANQAFATAMPQGTAEAKAHLCSAINTFLASFDLGIKDAGRVAI